MKEKVSKGTSKRKALPATERRSIAAFLDIANRKLLAPPDVADVTDDAQLNKLMDAMASASDLTAVTDTRGPDGCTAP